MSETNKVMGDLVRLKPDGQIGILMEKSNGNAIVFWGNGLCAEGPEDQLEAIPYSPEAQITANFLELVESFKKGRVWMREGSPGSRRFA